MTCLFCNEKLEEGLSTYVRDVGNCMVIVKDVPCMKCPHCGYPVYSDGILKQLGEIMQMQDVNASTIAVVHYPHQAA